MPSVCLKSPFRDQESTLWEHLAIPWTRRTKKVGDTFAFEALSLHYSHKRAIQRHHPNALSFSHQNKLLPSGRYSSQTGFKNKNCLQLRERSSMWPRKPKRQVTYTMSFQKKKEMYVLRSSDVRIYQHALFRHCNSERLLLRKSTSVNLLHGSVRSPPRILNARTRSGRRSASLESRGGRILMIQILPRGH